MTALAGRIAAALAALAGRVAAACLYLTASRGRIGSLCPARFDRLGGTLMLLGPAWGLICIGVWEVTFRLTWQWRLNWMVPAGACAAATVGGPCLRGAAALVDLVGRLAAAVAVRLNRPRGAALVGWVWRRRRWARVAMVAALGVGLAAVLNHAVRWWDPDWPRHAPPWLAWLWPRALYRMLLLAPTWGAWSMLAVVQFHRPGRRCDQPTRRLAGGTGALATAAWMAAPLAGSLIYGQFLYPWHFVPPAAALAAALAGGSLLVALQGGSCRRVLLAANLLTQVAFLAAYLTVR